MSQELISFSAQKIKIKALRGNKFELTVRVKNSDGTDYDFTSSAGNTDLGFFQVFKSNGMALSQDVPGYAFNSSTYDVDFIVSVSDGQLEVSTRNDIGFWPTPGTYKYSLFTERIPNQTSELDYWLYGDFIVVDDNPSSTMGGTPVQDVGLVSGGGTTYQGGNVPGG